MPRETGRAGYKAKLVKELERRFPGCVLLAKSPNDIQGFPDLLMLYQQNWVVLEVKAAANSDRQPNQEYWVDLYDTMSFGAFIYPENEEDILNELEQTFSARGPARFSQS
jgi:hypothetical protein